MPVSNNVSRWVYDGNGATTTFQYTSKIFAASDLALYVAGLLVSTGYTVTGVGEQNGGNVVFDVAPVAGTSNVVLLRTVPYTQEKRWPLAGTFPSPQTTDGFDRAVVHAQQLYADLQRTIRLAATDVSGLNPELPTPVASMLLGIDAAGTALALYAAAALSDSIIPTAFGASLLDDADAAEGRATLAAAGLAVVNAFTAMQKWALGTAIDDDDVAAGILTLPTDGNTFSFSGTETLTGIATVGAGTEIEVHHASARDLTHHATDLVLPGADDITTAAGDVSRWKEYATGDWRCTNYMRASGEPVAVPVGLRQTALAQLDTHPTTTSTSFVATGLSVTLAADLKSVASKVRIRVYAALGNAGSSVLMRLTLHDGTSDLKAAGVDSMAAGASNGGGNVGHLQFEFEHTPGSVTPKTYALQWKTASGTAILGADSGAALDLPTIMVAEEIVPLS